MALSLTLVATLIWAANEIPIAFVRTGGQGIGAGLALVQDGFLDCCRATGAGFDVFAQQLATGTPRPRVAALCATVFAAIQNLIANSITGVAFVASFG